MKVRIYQLHMMEDPDRSNPYPSYGQVRAARSAIGTFLQSVHCQRIDNPLYSRPYEDTPEVKVYDRYRGKGVLIDETIGPVLKQDRFLLSLDITMAGEEALLDRILVAMDKEIQVKTKYLSALVNGKSQSLDVPDNFYLTYQSVQELQEHMGMMAV